jgi:hypothetical protein
MLSTTDPFADAPRAIVPFPIDPVIVWEFAATPAHKRIPIERIVNENRFLINVEVLDAQNISVRYFFTARLSSSSSILRR